MLMLLLTLWARPAAACTPAVLSTAVQSAVDAFAARDADGVIAAREQAWQTLACLEEPLTPELARRLYLAHALAAFVSVPRDEDAVQDGLAGVLAGQPDYRLSVDLDRDNLQLDRLLQATRQRPEGATAPVELPAGCCLLIDGEPVAVRPEDRPVLVQLTDDDGAVMVSGWLTEGEGLPTGACPVPQRSGRRLWLSAGVGVGVTAGLAGAAWVQHRRYAAIDPTAAVTDAEAEAARIEALRRSTNTLGYAAQAAGGVTVGLLAAGVVVSW